MGEAGSLAAAPEARCRTSSTRSSTDRQWILWIVRTGAPWRDLPERYGPWRTVASRFSRWVKAGVWQGVLEALQQQADAAGQINWEKHSVDSTIIRAHQHAAGAKGGNKIRKR
jgi:transposase